MNLSVVILTGQSGSGKSTAVAALEDQDYYCVDNLPVTLAEDLIDLIDGEPEIKDLALVMDARGPKFAQHGPDLIRKLRKNKVSLRLIYLEAAEEILIRRYSETRRRHPADEGQGVRAAVHDEKKSLQGLRELADQVIDTSQLSPHQLRAFFIEDVAGNKPGADLRIVVQSFGFKYGILLEADIVSDVRFLKNPYFIPELREFSGKDSQVRDFVLGNPDTQEFLEHSSHTLDFLIPRYKKEGKRYLTVGIGCTGGRHRSVAIAIEQAERLKKLGWDVVVNHRDLVEGKI